MATKKTTPKTAAKADAPVAHLVLDVPIAKLHPSPTNYRRRFPKESLEELGKSLASQGQAQAIIVRPHPDKAGHYEIVVGERRFRAAKLAKLPTLRAEVREYDPLALMGVQLAENAVREDVSPIEEAEHFQRMLDAGAKQIEIAAAIGRPDRYVRRRLRLLKLTPDVVELVHNGRLTMALALDVAHLPDGSIPAVCERIAADAKQGRQHPLQEHQVQSAINATMRWLGRAPWELEDVICGKACADCPLRYSVAFPKKQREGEQDRCLDAGCYNERLAAYGADAIEKAKAAGERVLDAPLEWNQRAGIVHAGDKHYEPEKSGAERVAWIDPYDGKLVRGYVRSECADAWKAKGEEAVAGAVRRGEPYIQAAKTQAGESQASAFRDVARWVDDNIALHAQLTEGCGLDTERLRLLCKAGLHGMRQGELKAMGKRRGWSQFNDPLELLEYTDAELLGLLVEIALAPDLYVYSASSPLAAALKTFIPRKRAAAEAAKASKPAAAKAPKAKAAKAKTAKASKPAVDPDTVSGAAQEGA